MNTIVIIETYSEVQERQNKTDKKQTHKKRKKRKETGLKHNKNTFRA